MATTIQQAGQHVPLERIRVPENVRVLDEAHVEALAGSIKLQGMLVPLVVREGADGFELVAGFHRIAAARSLGLAEVPVVVRDVDTEDADRAVENITRKQLSSGQPQTPAADDEQGRRSGLLLCDEGSDLRPLGASRSLLSSMSPRRPQRRDGRWRTPASRAGSGRGPGVGGAAPGKNAPADGCDRQFGCPSGDPAA
jgi:ParB-like nuclease family protein